MTTTRSNTAWPPDFRRFLRTMARWRAGYREWRRTRPFWGGLLLVIAGLELLALPLYGVLSHHAIKLVIYIGIGGVFGVLIGILLIAAGIMCWLTPAQRVFYGIAGIVLGLGSFPATNLGGFFLAMLLAIIGGSLAFSWTLIGPALAPSEAAPPSGTTDDEAAPEATTTDDEAVSAAETTADDIPVTTEDGPAPEPARDRSAGSARHRALAVATMPALLVAGLLASPARPATAARPAGSGSTCILFIICWPSSSPSPTASPSASASPSTSPSPGSSANPQPSVGTSSPAGGGGGGSSPGASASASPGASGKGKSSSSAHHATAKQGSAGAGLVASSATSVLTAGSATLSDFKFIAIVNMPLANGGTEKMLEFTASSADLTDGVNLSVTQSGLTTVTSSPTLDFNGSMTLYATKLSGDLLGVPLTFTPTTIDAILLKIVNLATGIVSITLTNVVTDQPLTSANSLTTGALSLGF
jgi:hypothetical protein